MAVQTTRGIYLENRGVERSGRGNQWITLDAGHPIHDFVGVHRKLHRVHSGSSQQLHRDNGVFTTTNGNKGVTGGGDVALCAPRLTGALLQDNLRLQQSGQFVAISELCHSVANNLAQILGTGLRHALHSNRVGARGSSLVVAKPHDCAEQDGDTTHPGPVDIVTGSHRC
ncbi:unannotated protein [freshwater metagenome]|uniref:Unannotated protein n=1 Tax=freshwater metagenome TaxID=449393 RepID=A0A6J6JMW9_9ZZZZ